MTSDTQTDTKTSQNNNIAGNISKLRPSRKNTPHSWFDDPYNPVRGESALWVAVITQAMMDALSRSANKEAQYHKHEALRWLTENSKDFIEVCLSAGFDPDDVRRKAKRALLNPSSWRAAPGAGKRYLERKTYRERLKERQIKLKLRKEGHLAPPTFMHEALILQPLNGHIIVGPWA